MKKKLLWVVLLFAAATTFQRCSDEGQNQAPEKVTVTFSLSVHDNAGGRTNATRTPDVLLLSLQNSARQPVFTNKKIELLIAGDSYLTVPIELAPGRYIITDFFLATDTDTILYAVPKKGSALASAVLHPVPYGLNITNTAVSNVEMEVIDVSQNAVENFGYASFNVNVVNPLRISVFAALGDAIRLTDAKGYILNEDDTVKTFTLAAKGNNLISFKGDADITHKLVICKPGYITYSQEFIYNDLIASLDGRPLQVYLSPAFIMVTHMGSLEFALNGDPGALSIDWGDGTSEPFALTNDDSFVSHIYATDGHFPITITGDLQKIKYFYSFYGNGALDSINTQSLSNLKEIRFGLTNGPKVIDLRYNKKIEFIMMTGLHELEELLLPDENSIYYIDISGPNLITTSGIDQIINKIYATAVMNNVMNGGFQLNKQWYPPFTGEAVGPPSEAGIMKLRELRDSYNWSVLPDSL